MSAWPEALGLGVQLGVLALDRLQALDLGQAEAQQVRLLGALAGAGGQLLERGLDLLQAVEAGLVLGQRLGDGGPGVTVQRLALAGGLQQRLLRGLPVHRHQVVGQAAQDADRDGGAAQARARAPLSSTPTGR